MESSWVRVIAECYDNAMIFGKAHYQKYNDLRRMEAIIFLLITTITAITSTVNLSMTMFRLRDQRMVAYIIGALNLFVAVLRSISEKLDLGGLVKLHRMGLNVYAEIQNTIIGNLYSTKNVSKLTEDTSHLMNSTAVTVPALSKALLEKVKTSSKCLDASRLQLPPALRSIGLNKASSTVEAPECMQLKPEREEPAVVGGIHWCHSCEMLLNIYLERFQVNSSLYSQAFQRYKMVGYSLAFPSIILSCIAGAGNFSVSSLPAEAQQTANLILGLMTTTTIVISSVESFFEVGTTRDMFQLCQKQYDAMYRDIMTQLSLARGLRTKDGASLLKDAIKLDISLQNLAPPLSSKVLDGIGAEESHSAPFLVRMDPFEMIFERFIQAKNKDYKESVQRQQSAMDELRRETEQDKLKREQEIQDIESRYQEVTKGLTLQMSQCKDECLKKEQQYQALLKLHEKSVETLVSQKKPPPRQFR